MQRMEYEGRMNRMAAGRLSQTRVNWRKYTPY